MDAKQFLKEKGISNSDFMDSGVADLIEILLTEYQALQLLQTGVMARFFRLVFTDEKGDQFYTISNKETEELALKYFYEKNPNCKVYRVDVINEP